MESTRWSRWNISSAVELKSETFPSVTGDDDAVAHAVKNRLQHLGLVAQLLFGPGQGVGSLLEGRAAFGHALLQRLGERLQFLLCASALDDLLLERGPAAFELDIGVLQRRVPPLDLFEHAVEAVDKLADFVAGGSSTLTA